MTTHIAMHWAWTKDLMLTQNQSIDDLTKYIYIYMSVVRSLMVKDSKLITFSWTWVISFLVWLIIVI